MSRSDIVTVGRAIPKIASVEARKPFTLLVEWRTGDVEEIDVAPMITAYKVFRPLRDAPALFTQVKVDEYGSAVVWSDSMDLANYTLDRLAQVSRPMSREAFRAWMKRNGLTLDTAAPVLGISRRQAAAFSSGEKTVNRATKLACLGYDAIMGSGQDAAAE